VGCKPAVHNFKEIIIHILAVRIQVKPESIEAFKALTMDNASNSIHEEGVLRFDLFQLAEDSASFMLFEVYKTPEDHLKHRETAHYQRWRDGVTDMMSAPRQAERYVNVYPGDETWKK